MEILVLYERCYMTVEVEATFQKNGEILTRIFDGTTHVTVGNVLNLLFHEVIKF